MVSSPSEDDSNCSSAGRLRFQRFSIRTESQIEVSKRISNGITSNASETGSTVGSRTANASMSGYPIRRLRRSFAELRTRIRTSARMKIGISNAIPLASKTSAVNDR